MDEKGRFTRLRASAMDIVGRPVAGSMVASM